MPLFRTIVLMLVHAVIAVGLNFVAKAAGLVQHSEIMTLYFILLAGRYKDIQIRFEEAYAEDPDTTEQILRDELT